MAGFRKAKAEQAALKIGMYGPPGSGKTFTALLLAEGLAKFTGKRAAFVDTEHGSDFYRMPVPSRRVHPDAFDFDVLDTKSITEASAAVKALSPDEYGVLVYDSMTHLWQATTGGYQGKLTSKGGIPITAWGKVKKPYKDLLDYSMSSTLHLFILGRQGNEIAMDEESDEMKVIGVKMKAEGETPYEPHILIRMEAIKPKKTNQIADVVAYIEKDRTGVLSGRSFVNPNFETLCVPLLGLLGKEQAQIQTSDETSSQDAERMAEMDIERSRTSRAHYIEFTAKLNLAQTLPAVKEIGKAITPQVKAQMLPEDVANLRERYLEREKELS